MAADRDTRTRPATTAPPELPPPAGDGAGYRICMVCLGNICRSPTAEVILRDELDRAGLGGRVTVQSAGTGDWHIGGPMDSGARAELTRRGYDGSAHVARQITADWGGEYDLFVVMDRMNLANLRRMFAGGPAQARIRLMRSFDPAAPDGAEVPDPYHGTPAEYEAAFDLVLAAARGLTRELAALLAGEAGLSSAAADQRRLERLIGTGIRDIGGLGGQHGVAHYRLELADGRAAFAKVAADGSPAAGLAAEASGLRWLGDAAAVPVPEVLGGDDYALVISWITAGVADRRSAIRFGRELALLHRAGSSGFGAPWPGVIAGLPLPSGPGPAAGGTGPAGASWGDWYAAARLLPYVRIGRDRGALSADDAAVVEAAAARAAEVAGPAEPPSRIHGDCWSGNVLWSGGRGWLIDPAAHGGHRESDLAMLSLFGAPHLGDIRAAYQEAAPLADGWAARVPLHQLHPLLVHVCLFGGSYTGPAVAAARAVLVM